MRLALLFIVTFWLTGCVVGNREIQVNTPEVKGQTTSKNISVYIDSVTDNRTFEFRPSKPSIPSLDEDVLVNEVRKEKPASSGFENDREKDKVSAEERIKAMETLDINYSNLVGRQRNGYGKAMGNVSLENNQGIEEVVSDVIKKTLAARGYNITDNTEAQMQVTVLVNKFWGWYTPVPFAEYLSAQIETDLQFSQGDSTKQLSIFAESKETHPMAMFGSGAWGDIFELALANYVENLNKSLDESGL